METEPTAELAALAAASPAPVQLDKASFEAELEAPPQPALALDEEVIFAEALKPAPNDAAVVTHHRECFAAARGARAGHLRSRLEVLSTHLQHLDEHLTALRKLAAGTDKFIDIAGEGVPWSGFHLVTVTLLALVSVGLTLIGMNSLAALLMNSGLPGFDSPFMARTFSFTPFAAAFALKSLAVHFSPERNRRRFAFGVTLLGVCLAALWAFLFVRAFGEQATQSVEDLLADLMTNTTAAGDASGQAMLFVGLLAEMCLAASCWMEIDRFFLVHKRATRVVNPKYRIVEREVSLWANEHALIAALASRYREEANAIECDGQVYVTKASSRFQLVVASLGVFPMLASVLEQRSGALPAIARSGRSLDVSTNPLSPNGHGVRQ